MKKNIAMRVAAILFILTMISTCAFSTTFAKYVTSNNAEDSARVAKWGVTVTAYDNENNGLFITEYTGTESNITVRSNSSATEKEVLAPGTSGDFTHFDIKGTPEVRVRVTYDAELILTGWEVDGAEYCPLVITVNGVPYQMDGTNNTIAKLEEAVEAAIKSHTKEYDPNTELTDSAQASDELAISWAWAYSTSDANDVKDTALGDLATAPTVSLNVTCTVTQVD